MDTSETQASGETAAPTDVTTTDTASAAAPTTETSPVNVDTPAGDVVADASVGESFLERVKHGAEHIVERVESAIETGIERIEEAFGEAKTDVEDDAAAIEGDVETIVGENSTPAEAPTSQSESAV